MKQAIQILEFNKIKQTIESLCACSLGQKRVALLKPTTIEKDVEYGLNQSDEALRIIYALGEAPLGGVSDISEAIARAKISAILSSQELLAVSRLLYAVSQMKSFAERLNEIKVDAPIFAHHTNTLVALSSLQNAINACIDETGYVMDSASGELRSIRRAIQSTESRIKERLNQVVSERRSKLTDGIVTIRNERYVVPVRADYKNTFGGTIHDQSSSGNTYFMEPKEVVDLNNKLQEWHVEERREIERILRELTEEVKKFVDLLSLNVELLGEIDFMFAKGKYARLINGTRPKINTKGIIRLVAARHPLIDQKSVVANDIELGDEYTTIVITGPNTGGKTVTLKTVGLLTLMAQAGLLIPAHESSQLAIFDHVFADIGDEQSIEQSLSTFSSHMTNIVKIMERLTVNSLILFDELGAGTDPKEGASLAISILNYVKVRGARTIATSHYPELKAYAYEQDDVINASVEFNVETLSPTYRLLVGVPGRSNAFEISKRLGLKEAILNQARSYVESERTEMTDLITKLEDRGLQLDQEIQHLQQQNTLVEEMKKEYEQKLAKFEAEREKVLEDIKKEAFESVRQAKEEAEQIVMDLRQAKKMADLSMKDHELTEKLTSLKKAEAKQAEQFKKKAQNKQPLKPGDEVMVLSLNRQGELIEQTKNGEWMVQLGMMKVNIKPEDLQYLRKSVQKKETKKGQMVHKRNSHVGIQLDLRGERYEDAMLMLDKYFDDVLLAGYQTITIIHGHGTGALRQGVHKYLKQNKHVASFRFGGAGEGGTGATVVELK
ncbi:endonuclease MutS2 [Turicibacter sanguinis]|uniref:Endonuclease MutS2 n=5 Tax=Turicibacter TaxID=191303 RepID=A0A9X5AQD0_9FIRM|nr:MULTISPECIES: endonuclease MutS2 [Turicibacter]EFF63204.1 putative recombination and DNA strand exchange inhibitor protein [Turicibacter sanguinis PC909]EGC91231.1 recombination and DNA strand exchange inhibitor protein [Turicibacter sp. HGF1]MCU7192676.1 endonuclease MutS2 [Turicibacter sanguinis]MCU7203406.1 endonuclease MutS2 [Turicibacter sanguinis]MDB8541764.1 endonuclease MutS2 [Turicibacter sanguinis]